MCVACCFQFFSCTRSARAARTVCCAFLAIGGLQAGAQLCRSEP
jgi:hypothetical protein